MGMVAILVMIPASSFEQMASEKMFKTVDGWTVGGQTEAGVIGILFALP